jgi:hypothetical protein
MALAPGQERDGESPAETEGRIFDFQQFDFQRRAHRHVSRLPAFVCATALMSDVFGRSTQCLHWQLSVAGLRDARAAAHERARALLVAHFQRVADENSNAAAAAAAATSSTAVCCLLHCPRRFPSLHAIVPLMVCGLYILNSRVQSSSVSAPVGRNMFDSSPFVAAGSGMLLFV